MLILRLIGLGSFIMRRRVRLLGFVMLLILFLVFSSYSKFISKLLDLEKGFKHNEVALFCAGLYLIRSNRKLWRDVSGNATDVYSMTGTSPKTRGRTTRTSWRDVSGNATILLRCLQSILA